MFDNLIPIDFSGTILLAPPGSINNLIADIETEDSLRSEDPDTTAASNTEIAGEDDNSTEYWSDTNDRDIELTLQNVHYTDTTDAEPANDINTDYWSDGEDRDDVESITIDDIGPYDLPANHIHNLTINSDTFVGYILESGGALSAEETGIEVYTYLQYPMLMITVDHVAGTVVASEGPFYFSYTAIIELVVTILDDKQFEYDKYTPSDSDSTRSIEDEDEDFSPWL